MTNPILLLKALGAGERWITIHPNGPDAPGQPVLIKQDKDGSAHVIGGAGGKINNLRMTGVRSQESYKQEAANRAKERREQRKRQQAQDRKDGLTASKTAATEAVNAQEKDQEAKFLQTAMEAMGWKPEDIAFPEHEFQNATPAAHKLAEQKHARSIIKAAEQAAEMQRQAFVQDAEARAEVGLGEVPLTTSKPDELSVADLAPLPPPTERGLGFAPAYGKRAEQAGLTEPDLRREAEAAKPKPADPVAAKEASDNRKAKADAIAAELTGLRDPAPKLDAKQVLEAKKGMALLKAHKQLVMARRQAQEHRRKIEASKVPVEPKAYPIEVGKPVDLDVVRGLENDLRTLRTRGFLDEIGKITGGNTASLGKHIGVGAFNSINALALAAGGAALLDRSVVDVLGPGGAADVLARRLHSDLTGPELDQVRDAMETFHVSHYMRLSDQSLREAREWQEMAHEIDLGEAANGADLAVAQELNGRRRDFIGRAQQTLGTALGEMEANAALVVALRRPKQDKIDVSLGNTTPEAAITQARALGLERGEYHVERVGQSTFLSVTGAGMDRLAQPVAREDLARVHTALGIMRGDQDEEGWLPAGVARRPDIASAVKGGTAPRLAQPFARSPSDMGQAVKDYIGGRTADGDPAADIVADLLSEETMQRAGDRSAFMAAVNDVLPLYDKDGKMRRAEEHQAAFNDLADDFAQSRFGSTLPALHRQQFAADESAADALHRALAADPEGIAAWKPVGELTPQDQAALRSVFAREFGRSDPKAEELRSQLERLDANEPERETVDMFGSRVADPAWQEWQAQRNELAEKANASAMNWGKYLAVMGSPADAYVALQDIIKSKVLRTFADTMAKLHPESPLKLGRAVIRNDLDHLDAVDQDARDQRLAEHRKLADSLRERAQGRYAPGSVKDKLDAAREAEEARAQSQMGLFGAAPEPAPSKESAAEKPLAPGQRWTIGHAAERQVAGMMPAIGANFEPGKPVKVWQADMSGKFINRQRAVKLIEANKRAGLGMGVGSGKTSIALSAFTDLKDQGKVSKGLFVVPSVVQGQFGAEGLALLEPGKYHWYSDPGGSRADRLRAYKDPKTDFAVVTHQSFRDDMLHLAAERDGGTPAGIADKLDKMTPVERATYMRELMASAGITADYIAVDEGHNLLNRAGKENSAMANVTDGVTDNAPYYVSMTADPVKNDVSEAFDALAKMDRGRYGDRDAFMRKYGADTAVAKDALRRELARHYYLGRIDAGVAARKQEVPVDLDEGQREELHRLDDAAARAKLARLRGGVDEEALKELSPGSFANAPPELHATVAADLNRSIGILHDTAKHRTINGGAKTEALVAQADARRGQPGVVFVHSLERVKEIAARLEKAGHRVVTLTGADTSKEKDAKKREYRDGKYDIMVASDAAAVGANLQYGQWLCQYDTPMTAMLHAQRNGRIHRFGQKRDVDLVDIVANHPEERRARKRLADKYELRSIVTSPLDGLDDEGIAGVLNRVRAGQAEAEQPLFMPAGPDEPQPVGDEQHSMF